MFFTKNYLDFFKELSANNNKNWFDENRNRYENDVRKPFIKFIEALFNEIKKETPFFCADAKKSLYRINRDIRFSKDKTPYNLHMSSAISPTGNKGKDESCFYILFPNRFSVKII